MRHGAVDQTVKNAMLTSEDGKHYYYILYDNDTTHGLRNDSILIYPPTIDRKTEDPTFAVITYAFAGHDSVLWNNLEEDDEFMENALHRESSFKKIVIARSPRHITYTGRSRFEE